jgi:hypothetical protein
MCLIIFAPKSTSIPSKYITNAFAHNDDGAGVSYVRDGQVIIEKGFFKVEELQAALFRIGNDTPRIIHFRYATLGAVNTENCHPFPLTASGGAVAHNGPCVHDDYQGDAKRSDSRHLAEDLLDGFDQATLFKVRGLLDGFVNAGNKLAFLFPDESHLLINEKLGTWRKNIWLSNTYSVEDVKPFKSSWPSKPWGKISDDEASVEWAQSSLWPTNGTAFDPDLSDMITLEVYGQVRNFYYDNDAGDWYNYNLGMSIEELLPFMDATSLAEVKIVECTDEPTLELLDSYGIRKDNAPPKVKATFAKRDKPRLKLAYKGGKK